MTVKQLIAEVTSTLRQYEESGLIDHRSLKLWIKQELKTFGSPLMVKGEKVLEITQGSIQLPDDFWSLDLALKCDADGYKIECGEKSTLIRSSEWRERIEQNYEWDNQSNQHIGTDYKKVTIREYIDKDTEVSFRYGNFIPLTLVKGIDRKYISDKCHNKFLQKSPYQINIINGEKLQTNFKKGSVYIQYNALPTDEFGNLHIPDVDELVKYLDTYLKKKILESLWLNGDDDSVQNRIAYLKADEKEFKSQATTRLRFEALGKNWPKKLQAKMRQDTAKFESLFPNT